MDTVGSPSLPATPRTAYRAQLLDRRGGQRQPSNAGFPQAFTSAKFEKELRKQDGFWFAGYRKIVLKMHETRIRALERVSRIIFR